jgi:hypothetical protein
MIEDTELNAVIIDVKDNTGVITWDGRANKGFGDFIESLHKKNIYVIGRIASFQDPEYVKAHPEEAVQNIETQDTWKDNKGVVWVDPGSKNMWRYLSNIGHDAYNRGFDEINFDYIRFPTDGNLKVVKFPISKDDGINNREKVIKSFYEFLYNDFNKDGIIISGDVFGIITTNKVEIKTLGQDLRDAFKYFDYVAPMVYPSHFYPGTIGFENPAEHPKEIIEYAMKGAIQIARETSTLLSLSLNGEDANSEDMSQSDNTALLADNLSQVLTEDLIKKLRPWYQDFDIGAVYTANMVRDQIEAGYSLGINSWMLWDPSNHYTVEALKDK